MKKDKIILFTGSPGSGKTTYSQLLFDYYISLDRNVVYVNLDCFNESSTKENLIDIKTILSGNEILSELHIGPNCSIFFSIEYLYKNLKWLEIQMTKYKYTQKEIFFFFDLPGQIELFTHYQSLKNIINRLNKTNFISNLILSDSFFWFDNSNFHTLALTNLMMVINIEAPFFHILTKIDLCKKFNLKRIAIGKKRYNEPDKKTPTIFSWGNRIKFSIEDIIFDFGIINPTPIDLTLNFHMLNIIKYLDRYY